MYKHDDYMVMDGDTAALSHNSPQAMEKYQRELAAVYNTIHSQERLIDIMSIERGVDGTLLSLLCTLLGLSVINSPDRSSHYSYYLQVHGPTKALPTTSLMDRLNSHESVWGFPYGSLGYPMYLYPTIYMHPSRMVKVCSDHYLRTGVGTTLEQYMEPIQAVLNNIQVLGVNLPVVVDWYLSGGYQHTPAGDMEGKAYVTLTSIARVWLQSGLCPISKDDVLHLTLPPQWRALYEEMMYLRRACEWVPSSSTGTIVEQLLLPLMEISTLSDPQGLRVAMSYALGICAPGGWDLLLVVLATQVINKLYVEAYQNPSYAPPDMGEVVQLLGQANAPTIQKVGLLVRGLNDARE
jgi:hypothetical protein